MKLVLKISAEDSAKTVKHLLKTRLHISERLIKKLKRSGRIMLNSVPVHVNARVSEGDILEALIEFEEENEDIVPEKMDLDIICEDDCLIAINKPPDTVVHPTVRHFTGTVANGLRHHLLSKGVKTLIRPVSRLDRDTSGVIVFALNPYVQNELIRQMHDNTYQKEYLGIVHGTFTSASGIIDLPIERLPGSIMLRHTSPEGAPSVTRYEVIEQFADCALLKFRLITGRTHQIRVHCQAAGHPLVGDTLYSLPEFKNKHIGLIRRQALHSALVSFNHPLSGSPVKLKAPLPNDMLHALEILRK
ncbi:MAG: RluA family pseudouridine synthase [Clostridiaceae bacterium]|nr:RluA family pseudouridine synthase [Clostridiaceae bacterium]